MVKKGQWRYVASTVGGTLWEKLLEVYMNQERRLEFTEVVSGLVHILPTFCPVLFNTGGKGLWKQVFTCWEHCRLWQKVLPMF